MSVLSMETFYQPSFEDYSWPFHLIWFLCDYLFVSNLMETLPGPRVAITLIQLVFALQQECCYNQTIHLGNSTQNRCFLDSQRWLAIIQCFEALRQLPSQIIHKDHPVYYFFSKPALHISCCSIYFTSRRLIALMSLTYIRGIHQECRPVLHRSSLALWLSNCLMIKV